MQSGPTKTFVGFQRGSGSLIWEGVTLNLPNANLANPTEFDGEMVSSGVVSPTEVAFRLNTLRSRDAGTVVQAGVMNGTSTWEIPIKPKGNITVTGTWTTIKQNQ